VAAPLLALGAPLAPLVWALPPAAGHSLALPIRQLRWLGKPLVAFALHSAAIWLWHLPGPYQAALDSGWLHLAEHASLLGTAVLFWWALLRPRVSRPEYGLGVLYVFLVSLQSTALGALLTLASAPWYRAYGQLADQQLAGLLMWVPAGMLYLLIALAMFGAWLRALDSGH
jgi:putative membrane protein